MEDDITRTTIHGMLGQIQALERRAGRTASRISVGIPHGADLDAAKALLCSAICSGEESAPDIQVSHIASRMMQLLTVDFDLPEAHP